MYCRYYRLFRSVGRVLNIVSGFHFFDNSTFLFHFSNNQKESCIPAWTSPKQSFAGNGTWKSLSVRLRRGLENAKKSKKKRRKMIKMIMPVMLARAVMLIRKKIKRKKRKKKSPRSRRSFCRLVNLRLILNRKSANQ